MKSTYIIARIALWMLPVIPATAQTARITQKALPVMQKDATDQNKQQLRKLYETCLNGRRYELANEIFSDDYTGPSGERGPAGFTETLKALIDGLPDIQWTIDDLMADGDKAVVRWSWTGTHTGNFRGFKPSGNVVTNHAIAIYQFSNGKIVRSWIESDRLGFLTQIGAIPAGLIPPPGAKKQ